MGLIRAKIRVLTAKTGLLFGVMRGIRQLTTFGAAKLQSAPGTDNSRYVGRWSFANR